MLVCALGERKGGGSDNGWGIDNKRWGGEEGILGMISSILAY
jgi:hypothetical protein